MTDQLSPTQIDYNRSNQYLVSHSYKAIGPITEQQWEGPAFEKAFPVNGLWLLNNFYRKHIFVVNLTGDEIGCCYNITPFRDPNDNSRENVKSLENVVVRNGQTKPFNTLPHCIHLGFDDPVLNDRLTAETTGSANGSNFEKLNGKIVTIYGSSTSRNVSLSVTNATNALDGDYACIANTLEKEVWMGLYKFPVGPSNAAQEQLQKKSRAFDAGLTLIDEKLLKRQSEWKIKLEHILYTVRALQSNSTQPTPISGQISSVAPVTDFEQTAVATNVAPGQIVVFFSDYERSIVTCKVYTWEECKPVADNMVYNYLSNNQTNYQ